MNNRNFDTLPMQAGGRTQADYGRTVIATDEPIAIIWTVVFASSFLTIAAASLWLVAYLVGVI
jgi:hypothetical protein